MAELDSSKTFLGNRRWPDTVLMLVVIIPAVLGGISLTNWLQEKSCPWDSFLTGGLYPGWQMGFGFAALTVFFLLIRHWLLHRWDAFRRWSKVEINCDRAWHEHWGQIAALIFAVSALGFIVTLRAQYCLTIYRVMQRPLFHTAYDIREWQGVSELDLGCTRGSKGQTNLSYELVFRDGNRLDLSDSNEGLYWAREYLHQTLHDVPFAFDISRVAKNCPMSPRDPLWLKP